MPITDPDKYDRAIMKQTRYLEGLNADLEDAARRHDYPEQSRIRRQIDNAESVLRDLRRVKEENPSYSWSSGQWYRGESA
jgi:hypothetical protein